MARSVTDRAAFEINLKEKLISVENATTYRVCALIRKRSLWGILGWVYFLERRRRTSPLPGNLLLYGGKIEHSTEEEFQDANSRAAVARELNQETAPLDDPSRFKGGQFNEFASLYGKAENGEMVAVDIYTLQDDLSRQLKTNWIRNNQREKARLVPALLQEKREQLEGEQNRRPRDESMIQRIETEIRDLEDSITAGPPVKIRHFLGIWIRMTLLRTTVDWTKLSPFAAYALLMDSRQRRT
ncbi:MAG: hypothetical protein ABL957_00880 [Parvularculaceae bacterium]